MASRGTYPEVDRRCVLEIETLIDEGFGNEPR